jgi:hypothetical protein
MSENERVPDFFESLFDVNNHELQKPRVIGDGEIT